MAQPIRILVADDQPVARDGLVAMLSTQSDFVVVAEATDGVEAVELTRLFQPDVVLLDLEMPALDGIEAVRRMGASNPGAHVIVLAKYQSDERIVEAARAGARGYLLKN